MPYVKRSKAEAALAELRSAYDASIAEAGVVLVQQTAPGADSHHVSRSCLDLLGWDPTAFLTPGTLRSIVHVDDLAAFRTAATDPGSEAKVVRLLHVDGTYRHFRFGVTDRGLDQPLSYALVDVSSDASAAQARRRAAEVLEHTDRALLYLQLADQGDPSSFVIGDLNPAAERLLHNSTATTLGEVFSEQTRQLLQNAAFDVAHTGEDLALSRLVVGELPELVLDVALTRLEDGTIAMSVDDVTTQATMEQRLRDRALHDQRSGLPNMAFLAEQLEELERITAATVGLLAVDFGALELGADASGSDDEALVSGVARRLGDTRPGAFVARIGERRLVLLDRDLLGAEDLQALTQGATAALAVPFDINGAAIGVQATVGAALSGPLQSRSRLLRDAEDALRRATSQHRPWVIGTEDDRKAPSGLFHEVREGVGHGRMELRYQPVLELATGRIAKVEALLRWADGERAADESLELAERSGIPDVLPRWVVGEAAGAARWLTDSGFDQSVAINIGATAAVNGFEGLLGLLTAEGLLTQGCLEVEIPETLLTEDLMTATEMVEDLHRLGMAVVIDDFGAGYTSLSAVADLGVDGLKIDRSFITTLGTIPADEAVVRSTIEFCHELGIQVTALGVSDRESMDRLADMGCDLVQGSAVCEPVSLEDLPSRIADIQRSLV